MATFASTIVPTPASATASAAPPTDAPSLLPASSVPTSVVPDSAAPVSDGVSSILDVTVPPLPVTPELPTPTPPPTGVDRLLTADFYFDTTPYDAGQFLWGRPLAALFTALLIVAFTLLIRALLPRLKHRSAIRGAAYWLLFFGLMGDTLLFFRWQHAPVLSMRIWLVLLLLGLAAWIVVRLWGMLTGRSANDVR